MEKELITTGDGSHTFLVKELSEHYHSTHGAIQESAHVFIKHGLEYTQKHKQQIQILELGFGTGLNALLTYLATKNSNIRYTTVEPYPINHEQMQQLNYPELLGTGKRMFLKIHQAEWDKWIHIDAHFKLYKIKNRIEDLSQPKAFDLIYFDAFAPQVQPELWTQSIFNKMFRLLNPGGLLVTYCAKGSVKRALKNSGFKVESLPGPPGKREMTRAMKQRVD